MAIEKAFYQEGIPYASGMTVGVGAPLDLRCVIEYPAQLAAIGRGNVYEGMPFFVKNVDGTNEPGFFILTGRPYDTEALLDDDGNITAIRSYVKADNSKIVTIYENSTMNDLEEAGFTYMKIGESSSSTKMVWVNLCEE